MLRLGLALLFILSAVSVHAKELGSVGTTYGIAEKDALTEIEERAKGVDWGKVLQRKPIEEYDGPEDRVRLPRAGRDKAYAVDLTYTLPMDIPNGKGGILYPQGYTFNPLEYVAFTKTLVVINGNDPDQVKWFASSEYKSRIDVMLLLTEGNYGRLGKKFNVPLFYADSRIVERLQLSAVPSVVKQDGKEMVVREIAMPRVTPSNYKTGAFSTGGRTME